MNAGVETLDLRPLPPVERHKRPQAVVLSIRGRAEG